MKGGMGSGGKGGEFGEGQPALGRGVQGWTEEELGEEDHGKVENRRAECNHRAVEEEWRPATQSF